VVGFGPPQPATCHTTLQTVNLHPTDYRRLKIGKIRNIRFVGNLILNIHTTFLNDDIIIVTSSDNRTQSIWNDPRIITLLLLSLILIN